MGTGPSQEEFESFALPWYELSLNSTCVLPDVGIDGSLMKFSYANSSTELSEFSKELIQSVPGFVEKLGSAMGALSKLPHAVGLGALVISMIMEIAMKGSKEETPDSYSLLRRVFGEEKASGVRDTMSEYLKRHRLYINDDQRLLGELRRLEQQLSNQLTILRNSLQHDGQMSTRGFKIWVNGASFHVQMLIHEARLDIQAGKLPSESAYKVKAAIEEYVQNLDTLLVKFKKYKTTTTKLDLDALCFAYRACLYKCHLKNTESKCEVTRESGRLDDLSCTALPGMTEAYTKHVFTKYKQILTLKDHFSGISANVDTLIIQNDAFTLPSE